MEAAAAIVLQNFGLLIEPSGIEMDDQERVFIDCPHAFNRTFGD